MMQSILSLINETLTTSSTPASENTPKSGTRGEFESILTHQDHESARCTSATRIKARANSIEENGDNVSADDEHDDEEATTCVNVDDFAAWALTHTINAPPPSAASKNPSISMVAVKMKASPAPQPLPALNNAGETIPAAALAPKTQEFMAPMTQEMPSVKEDAPSSKAITREFPTPTAAGRTQELPAQMSSFIEKLARSQNATDIPPPSGIPMVSGAPPANSSSANRVAPMPQNHAPVIEMRPRNANNNNSKPNTKSNGNKLASVSNITQSNSALLTDVALRPTVLAMPADTRTQFATTPTRMLATMDIQAEAQAQTEARQAAADRAVNQLTLSRAADGEIDTPELGRVRVEAQTRNGEVDVRITAAREETQELVSNHTHEIVIDAQAAAIPIVDLRVKLDPRAEPMDFSQSRDSNNGNRGNSKNDNTSEKQASNARGNSRARFVL